MDHVIALLPGFVVGCFTVLIIGGLYALISGKARRKKCASKEVLISSVEGKWLDADSIVSSYRAGRITSTSFKNSLEEKIEAINRLYKPHIHQLDIFFIKYTEKLIEEYGRLVDSARPAADQTVLQEAPMVKERTLPEGAEVETGISAGPDFHVDATIAEQSQVLEPIIEQSSNEPVEFAPVPMVSEEEPIITAMTESSSEASDVLPIETFMEMETGMGLATEPVPLSEESSAGEEFTLSASSTEASTPYEAASGTSTELQQEPPGTEQTSLPEQEPVFEDARSYMPPPQYTELPERQEESRFAEETMVDQPSYEFTDDEPTVMETTALPPPPPPRMPPPYAPPFRERGSTYKRDETVEPATIYDIEAETIIADRSTIMGVKKPAKEESPKSGLGITGDDISDQLDNFFNIK